MKGAIHWIRRDLRITDNTALSLAVRQAQVVYPLFILDDAILAGPDVGGVRVSFLLGTLEALSTKLLRLGYSLTIRRGEPIAELLRFCRDTHAEAVFCNRDRTCILARLISGVFWRDGEKPVAMPPSLRRRVPRHSSMN